MKNSSTKSRKLALGVGVNDADYAVWEIVNGKLVLCPYYQRWKNMLIRCYSVKNLKTNPTYKGCTVCSEWLVFSNFRNWMEQQDWHGKQLDKDIICPGNKVYGPEMCCFVPSYVNLLLISRNASRGDYPRGVTSVGRRYRSICNVNSKLKHLGMYDTAEEASVAYRDFKSKLITKIAHQQTDEKVKNGLILHAKILAKRN